MLENIFSISIFGIRLDEPVTVATDIIIAMVCIYAFLRLTKIPGKPKFQGHLRYYFVLLAIGTFLGGVLGHGFIYSLSPGWKLPGWIISMGAIALLVHVSVLMLSDYVANWKISVLAWHNILLLSAFMILLVQTRNFKFTVIYITYGILIVVGGIHLRIFRISGSRGSLWFLLAVLTGLTGDFIFIFDWSLHKWFNNNDLSHILLAFSAWFFFLGSRLFLAEENRVDLAGYTQAENRLEE